MSEPRVNHGPVSPLACCITGPQHLRSRLSWYVELRPSAPVCRWTAPSPRDTGRACGAVLLVVCHMASRTRGMWFPMKQVYLMVSVTAGKHEGRPSRGVPQCLRRPWDPWGSSLVPMPCLARGRAVINLTQEHIFVRPTHVCAASSLDLAAARWARVHNYPTSYL